MTLVFGEFLGPAGEHIAAAVAFRGELPYSAQCQAVRQLDRLVATLARYLGDLPLPDPLDPARDPQPGAGSRAAPARLALDRAVRTLRPAAAGVADTDAGDAHPVAAHLSAAAAYLAAGRDLLHTHFADGPAGPQAPASWWAQAITSGPVTAALLGELAGYTHDLASWIAKLMVRRSASPGAPTSALLALRSAEPWLRLAAAAMHWPPPSPATPANSSYTRSPSAPASSARSPCSAPSCAPQPGTWPAPGNHGAPSPTSGTS